MPEDNSILNLFFEEVSNALSRVSEIFEQASSNPVSVISFLRGRGWDVSFDTIITSNATGLGEAIQDLRDLLDGSPEFSNILDAVGKMNAARSDIVGALGMNLEDDFLQALALSLPRQLLDYALTTYLEEEHPKVAAVLALLGILVIKGEEPTDLCRIPYLKREIRWEFLIQVLQAPERFHEHAYGWGSTEYDGAHIIDTIELALDAFGLSVARFEHDETANPLEDVQGESLLAEVFTIPTLTVGIEAYEVGEKDSPNAGLALAPFIEITEAGDVQIGDSLTVQLRGALEFRGSFGVQLRQESGVELFGLETLPTPEGHISVALVFARQEPLFRVGSEDRNMFALSRVTVGMKAELLKGEFDLEIEAGLQGLRLVLSTEDSDAFLSKILSDIKVDSEIDVTLGVGLKRGLFVRGSGSFDVIVPIHKTLGPIAFDSVCVSLGLEDGRIPLKIGVTLSAELGPIMATVERLGLRAELKPDGGNLGPVGLDFGFLPPTGAGLSVDADIIFGGGYLEFFTKEERYAGILALTLGEFSITAVGLITTKMPDGSKDFSMLTCIGIEFDPEIQLSMGFTLSGVGGLIGINRAMVIEELQKRFRSGAVKDILFPDPKTVISKADTIIENLRAVFPPARGKFVIGPMVKIGYGSPNVIQADIGIILVLPDLSDYVIMGKLKAAFPTPEEEIIKINMSLLGTLSLAKKEFTFQSSIYDSEILKIALWGDVAARLCWSDPPEFTMAMGGFHPKFTPPPPEIIFGGLRRLGLNVVWGKEIFLLCESYIALTPNSLQFGAGVQIIVNFGELHADGSFSFDALFYFRPFSFEITADASVNIKIFGVTLIDADIDLSLSGPTPWHARGSATVRILFCDVTGDFNITWGQHGVLSIPAIDPLDDLVEALNDNRNWSARLPHTRSMVEALQPMEADSAGSLVVHPYGSLEVRQSVLPLGIRLDKFGHSPITGHDQFDIKRTSIGSRAENLQYQVPEYQVREHMNLGTYKKLTKSEKLSKPSFEKMTVGVGFSSDPIVFGGNREFVSHNYESVYLTQEELPKTADANGVLDPDDARLLNAGSAAAKSKQLTGGNRKFVKPGQSPLARVNEMRYAIADLTTFTRASNVGEPDGPDGPDDQVGDDRSLWHVEQVLETYIEENPEDPGDYIVVAEYELEGPA